MYQTLGEDEPDYVLGHSPEELRRLESQSLFFRDLTRDVFRRAGISRGMSVVDIGCGPGDVSFLVSSLVGPEGSVVGIDKSHEAITTARERAAASGILNVKFHQGDAIDLALDEQVDAAVGRLALMYFDDPAVALRRIVSQVKPGGIITFQELDALGFRSLPQSLLFNQAGYWITETLRRGGADIQMGLKLYNTFIAAGLPAPQMILGGRVEAGPNSFLYEYMSQLVRSLLPMIERFGVANPSEIRIDTLAERMRDEAAANESVFVLPPLIGAWACKHITPRTYTKQH